MHTIHPASCPDRCCCHPSLYQLPRLLSTSQCACVLALGVSPVVVMVGCVTACMHAGTGTVIMPVVVVVASHCVCMLRLGLLSSSSWWWWSGHSMRAALGSSPSNHRVICWHWCHGHRCCHCHVVACVHAGAGVMPASGKWGGAGMTRYILQIQVSMI